MKCLLCNFTTTNKEEICEHYILFHQIDKNSYYSEKLFTFGPNSLDEKRCDRCNKIFDMCRAQKTIGFCFIIKLEKQI